MYNVHYVELLLLFLFITLCLKSLKYSVILPLSNFKRAGFGLFFLCIIYSIFMFYWSDNGLSILAGSLSLVYGFMAYLIADILFNENTQIYPKASRVLVTSIFVQLLYNMSSVIISSGTFYALSFYEMKEKSTTLLGGSNYIAFFFTFGLLYEVISKEKKWKLFAVLNLGGVVLTISRGAIFSLAASILLYLFISMVNKNIKKRQVLFTLISLFFGFYLFVNYTTPGRELWLGFQGGAVVSSSISARTLLWDATINQIKEQPFGNGITWKESPHNVILTAFRDLGVVFGSLYILFIGYPLINFIRFKIFTFSSRSIALLIAYLSVFLHSMVEIFYFNTTSIIWTAVTLAFIGKTLRDEKIQSLASIEPSFKNNKRFSSFRATG